MHRETQSNTIMTDIEKQNPSTPEFVRRDSIIADKEYVEWLHNLKQRYQQSQAKAAVRVNQALLEFYWSLGHDIVLLKAESQWGSGVLQQLSIDLQQMFPEQKGFSYRNIRYIKQWYSFYYQEFKKLHQAGAKLPEEKWHQVGAKTDDTKWQQVAAELKK